MPALDRADWEAAVLHLLDDTYVFAATGPRGHAEWRHDALSIMERSVVDPRGWMTLDWDKENDQERTQYGPAFPFIYPTIEMLVDHLHEITSHSAVELLVAMMDDWFGVKHIPGFTDRKEQLLADARTVTSRYGSRSSCYTTSILARTTKSPDFFQKESGGVSFTDYTLDLGLIIVSESEVGVFWAFNPI
ncbi:hypothetical protein [Streptomyces sp. H27-D2]|uniref:hypothetical protein n=1 Tax=Streptomyces sp. H27-D2 TaxID=3046304 RepID=UPI002DBD193E|nr:hypothetical protein [Streptomyces sp. H27-D2]MEC4020539.1 hypothetical protein [Streptomyces sp. H27-D2]